jgi:adenine-specific DNA-methyltransferase
MPTLEFKGKPFVYSHHLSVPFRELVVDPQKSFPGGKKASLEDNLIIHGDNLEALKALLPRYAGKVDVIYIDPPYNTGNEGWAYNDNVNSPLMKEWLGKVVDRDDLERHDKWLCMMWPRLQLLKELLAKNGLLFISIDETEIGNLYAVCDEIFGGENRFDTIIWKKRYGGGAKEKYIANLHEYIVVYCANKSLVRFADRPLTPSKIERYYVHRDDRFEARGPYRRQPLEAAKSMDERKSLRYPIKAPDGDIISPGHQWLWEEERVKEALHDGEIEFLKVRDGWSLQYKQYLRHKDGTQRTEKQTTVFSSEHTFVDDIYTQTGTAELRSMFAGESPISYPKPSALIETLLSIDIHPRDTEDLVILDSFAGSGTTAHAALSLNKEDGRRRKFILIETEDYADKVTAERIRRAIRGVPNSTDAKIKKGVGGSFTYCELGDSIDLERFFDGKGAPTYEQVARYIVYTATGASVAAIPAEPRKDWFVAEAGGYRIHLIYVPDLSFMRTNDAALSIETARDVSNAAKGKPVLVYAAAKFMSQAALTALGITFCQLPYSIHRVLGEAPDAP